MDTDEERVNKVLEMHESTLQHFVDKGELLLTVRVTDKTQADEIMAWMYATDKPMRTELLSISWDKSVVSKEEADFLEQMRNFYTGGY